MSSGPATADVVESRFRVNVVAPIGGSHALGDSDPGNRRTDPGFSRSLR